MGHREWHTHMQMIQQGSPNILRIYFCSWEGRSGREREKVNCRRETKLAQYCAFSPEDVLMILMQVFYRLIEYQQESKMHISFLHCVHPLYFRLYLNLLSSVPFHSINLGHIKDAKESFLIYGPHTIYKQRKKNFMIWNPEIFL